MRKIKSAVLTVAASAALVGCMNMTTPSSQITPAYVSGIKYEDYDLRQLSIEYDSLCRRESQLVIAQEQRKKSSEMQAFWWGFGQGDGVEASELANVRGEKEAVRRAMEAKGWKPGEPIPKTKPVSEAAAPVPAKAAVER
jgi:hypothetical protein